VDTVGLDRIPRPTALLNSVDAGIPIAATWNNITFPSTAVTSGNYYWLAVISDTNLTCDTSLTGGASGFMSASYASFTFPADMTGSFINYIPDTVIMASGYAAAP
jgi:hypothetical protein